MDTSTLLTIILFVTFLMVFLAIYKNTMEKKVKAKEYIQDLLSDQKKRSPTQLARHQEEMILRRKNKNGDAFIAKLEIQLEQANLMIRTNEFFLFSLGSAVLGFFVTQFIFGQPAFVAILIGVLCLPAPLLYLKIRVWLRMKKAAAQFADVLDALVNCFKTGYSFSRSIQVVSDNFEDPWGTEFGKMVVEMNLGSPQDDILYGLSKRIPLTDVELFVTALIIQKETGGNMAELLNNLSKTCRDRYKLFQKVGAISAQGKLSASIVTCIPFILMGLIALFLPDAVMKFVTNPIGIVLMIVAGIWMVIGIGVLFKMVQIEV